jgi:hypothetical protein
MVNSEGSSKPYTKGDSRPMMKSISKSIQTRTAVSGADLDSPSRSAPVDS